MEDEFKRAYEELIALKEQFPMHFSIDGGKTIQQVKEPEQLVFELEIDLLIKGIDKC